MTTAVHHDHDFYSWAMHNAQLLREGRLAEIDCEYVAEELEDMGAAKERELESRLGVLPARYLMASSGGAFRIETYWRLEPGEESVYASDRECEEAFLTVFGEAVRCRMRSSGPVAAMMSGGMDSASIAAMVKRLLPEMPGKEFHTYSAIADDPSTCVESQCIQSLTRDLGNKAHFVSVPSFQGMVGLDDLIETAWSKAHPVDNSILLPAMMCLAGRPPKPPCVIPRRERRSHDGCAQPVRGISDVGWTMAAVMVGVSSSQP